MSNSSPSSVVGATAGGTPSSQRACPARTSSRSRATPAPKCSATAKASRTSERFVVGGHNWFIKYYPDGKDKEDADGIAVYLYRDDNIDGKDVKAIFKISMLDQDGRQPVSSHIRTSDLRPFSPKQGRGFNKFIRKTDLEGSTYLKDDCFSIKCDVSETCPALFVDVPPPDMHQQLLHLLTSGHAGDVTFDVGDEFFTAHRYILGARSSVFMAELFGPMKEKAASCVRIGDMEAKVFKGMLHFIYTDSSPEIDEGETMEMAQHLLVAADRYSLQRLKLICEETLCNYISKSTAGSTLALAEQHGCYGLSEACFAFLTSVDNLKAVMASEGFAHLRSSCPYILEELVRNLLLDNFFDKFL